MFGHSSMKFISYIFSFTKSGLTPISRDQYFDDLLKDRERAKMAFEKAWETRNFEIEMYWKRATYFWAFIASALVGYFALTNTDSYRKPDSLDHVEVYFVVCVGLILATAWFLTNIGSKTWQRHWEVHVDLLEDPFTGPLYKTVHPLETFSVSKINEIVSFSFIVLWLLLGLKYFLDNDLINFRFDKINWMVLIATIGSALAIASMVFGHGRGRFSERRVVMHRRSIKY
jgi:hypothetical protein